MLLSPTPAPRRTASSGSNPFPLSAILNSTRFSLTCKLTATADAAWWARVLFNASWATRYKASSTAAGRLMLSLCSNRVSTPALLSTASKRCCNAATRLFSVNAKGLSSYTSKRISLSDCCDSLPSCAKWRLAVCASPVIMNRLDASAKRLTL